MTRVLMVGAGGVAQRHVRVLTELGAKVVGVVDPAEPAAAAVAAQWGMPAHAELDPALDELEPEVVYICVPPFAHGPAERAALARGLPFFVEKPLAVSTGVAEEIARGVEESGVVTGTGYHWRCLDTVERARQLAATHRPLLANGYWLGKRPPVAWWADVARSGGQVVEQMTHVLDVARLLLGEPVEVYAAGVPGAALPGAELSAVDDATAAVVKFDSGAVATFAATSILRSQHRASLNLFGAGTVIQLSETALLVEDHTGERQYEPAEDPRIVVDREFLEALRGERQSTRAPYADALRTHRLGCAVAESAREGVPLALDPATGCVR